MKAILICLLVLPICLGCEKFLDAKSDYRLAIPSTLADMQALLDRTGVFITEPSAGELSADDYFLTKEDWASLSSEGARRTYIWAEYRLFEPGGNDWTVFSNTIYVCNSVIEGLLRVNDDDAQLYADIKGQAHFLRAKQLLQASFIWCLAYDKEDAGSTPGLPLRLDTDFNKVSVRSTLEETFQQVIDDLQIAIRTLPLEGINVIRPSRPAAYGVMARALHYMRDYNRALLYADSCLMLKGELLDFNTLDSAQARPIPGANIEVISESGFAPQALNRTRGRVDTTLYRTYHSDDLRKAMYFRENADGTHGFRGRMQQLGSGLFTGISTSEMRLIRIECLARAGSYNQALMELDELRKYRWRERALNTSFVASSAKDPEEALDIILLERRKELLFRGIRWPDIKRLNAEGRQIGLRRNLGGDIFELPPNDPRFALPLPEDVIAMTGMEQNVR